MLKFFGAGCGGVYLYDRHAPIVKRLVLTVPIGKLTPIGFREADRSHVEYLDGHKKHLNLDQQVIVVRIRGFQKPDESWSNHLEISIDGVPFLTSLRDSFEPVRFAGHTFQLKRNEYKGQLRRPLLLEDREVQWQDGRPASSIERYIYRVHNDYHLPIKAGGNADRLRWVEETEPKSERILWNQNRPEFHQFEWSPGDVFLDSEIDADDPPDKALRRTTRLTDSERIFYELDDIQSQRADQMCAERYDNVSVRSSDLYVVPKRVDWRPVLDDKGQVDRTGNCILLKPHEVGGQILNDQRDADIAWLYQSLAHHNRWPKFITDKGVKVYPHNQPVMEFAEGFLKDLDIVADGSDEVKQYYLNQLRATWKLPKAQQLDAKREIIAEVKRLADGLHELETPSEDPIIEELLQQQLPGQLEIPFSIDVLLDRFGQLIEEWTSPLGECRREIRQMSQREIVSQLQAWYNESHEAPEVDGYEDDEYADDGFDVIDEETGVVHFSSQPCFDGIKAAAFYGYRPIMSNQVLDWPVSAREIIERAYPESAKPQQQPVESAAYYEFEKYISELEQAA